MENRLYLADIGNDIIQMIDFETQTTRTIVSQNLTDPVGIVVDHHSK